MTGCKVASKRVKFAVSMRQHREAVALTSMAVLIFVIFAVSILPYFSVCVANPDMQNPRAYLIALAFTWLNGCANPVVYALMNVKYQAAFKQLLRPFYRALRDDVFCAAAYSTSIAAD